MQRKSEPFDRVSDLMSRTVSKRSGLVKGSMERRSLPTLKAKSVLSLRQTVNGHEPLPSLSRSGSGIAEIWEYIARDNVQAARRVRLALLAACRRLTQYPGIGHTRQDLTDKPVLFFPVYSFLIIYDPATQPLEIVRVLSGSRDTPRLI